MTSTTRAYLSEITEKLDFKTPPTHKFQLPTRQDYVKSTSLTQISLKRNPKNGIESRLWKQLLCFTVACPSKYKMSSSVGSASRRTDCSISLGGGASRGGSTTCPSSNRVMVEEYFPNQYQDHICLLPEMGTSSLQGQRCNVKVYCVDIANRTFGELSYVKAQLSALLTCIDPNGNCVVELRCDLGEKNPRHNVWFRFKFDDQVRKVQILPLPLKTAFQFRQSLTSQQMVLQTLAVLLVVVSKRGGISVHSVVLSRTSDDDPFRIAEFKKVSRGSVAETGDSFDISLFLDNTHDVQDTPNMAHDTILYAGILPKSCSSQSHQLEVLACPLVCHKSPLFRFATTGPTRALRRSVVLTGAYGCQLDTTSILNLSYCILPSFLHFVKVVSSSRAFPSHLVARGMSLSVPWAFFSAPN